MVDRLIKVRKPSAYQGDKRKVSSSSESYSPFFFTTLYCYKLFSLSIRIAEDKDKKTHFSYFFYLQFSQYNHNN